MSICNKHVTHTIIMICNRLHIVYYYIYLFIIYLLPIKYKFFKNRALALLFSSESLGFGSNLAPRKLSMNIC